MSAYDYTSGTGAFDSFGAGAARIKTNRTHQLALETQRATMLSKTPSADQYRLADALAEIERAIVQDGVTNAAIQRAMALHLIGTADAEDELPAQTVEEAAIRLIEFMKADAKFFNDSNVAGSAAYTAANTGSGKMLVGVKNADGDQLQNIRAEDVIAECIADAQGPGGIIAGEELFTLKGEKALDRLHQDWPGGSGINTQIQSTHGEHEQSTRPGLNRLLNGGFERWTSNIPDGWTIDVGAALITKEATTVLRGTGAVKLTGDAGLTLAKWVQELNGTKGMKLKARTPYFFGVWVRDDGTAPAAGVLRVSIQDGASGVLTDDGANALSFTVDLTTIGSAYAFTGAVFWTPYDVHASAEIAVELTTALTSTEVAYIDGLVLAEAVQPHVVGPQFGICAGATNWVLKDRITATFTNDWANDTWIRETDRLFGMYDLGLLPPTSAAGNIADGLIV